MELAPQPPERKRKDSESENRAAATVIVMAAGTEPFKGEVLDEGLWWHIGQGGRLPVVRQGNRLRYYGPAWTYLEFPGDENAGFQ